MRRLWAVLIMSVIIGILCFFGMNTLNEYNTKMTVILNNAVKTAESEDFSAAKKHSQEAEKEWVKAEKALSFYLNRTNLYEIGANISQLTPLIENDDYGEFIAMCKFIITELRHLSNDEHG